MLYLHAINFLLVTNCRMYAKQIHCTYYSSFCVTFNERNHLLMSNGRLYVLCYYSSNFTTYEAI